MNIALGSHAELDTQLEIAERLAYVKTSDVVVAREKLTRVRQMLHGLERSLENSPTRYTGFLTLLGWLAFAALLG